MTDHQKHGTEGNEKADSLNIGAEGDGARLAESVANDAHEHRQNICAAHACAALFHAEVEER